MKYFVCLAFLASIAVTTVLAVAGQSACRDPSEVGKTYPNHWDPRKYWYCEKLNEVAIELECPHGQAYMHLLKACVPWASYIWKKPENPPTVA